MRRKAEGKSSLPTYVYRCPKCEKEIELIQSFKDKQAPLCDICVDEGSGSHLQMETIIQAGSFVLKGSCWARDGYTGGRK